MKSMTKAQERVFASIKKSIKLTGIPPTRKELANGLGFKSANAAECHLKAIERKGLIKLQAGQARGIVVTDHEANENDSYSYLTKIEYNIPIVGNVAAGLPIQSFENIEKIVTIDASIFSVYPNYLLRVKGDSMIDEGIIEGDLLAIEKRETCTSGEIVVVRVEDEVTVKKILLQQDRTELHAANKLYKPMILTNATEFFIEGRVVGLIRNSIQKI